MNLRTIYRLLSLFRVASVVASGNPKRIARYARNRAKAQLLRRSGFWR